jgi:hypothetical protein
VERDQKGQGWNVKGEKYVLGMKGEEKMGEERSGKEYVSRPQYYSRGKHPESICPITDGLYSLFVDEGQEGGEVLGDRRAGAEGLVEGGAGRCGRRGGALGRGGVGYLHRASKKRNRFDKNYFKCNEYDSR